MKTVKKCINRATVVHLAETALADEDKSAVDALDRFAVLDQTNRFRGLPPSHVIREPDDPVYENRCGGSLLLVRPEVTA